MDYLKICVTIAEGLIVISRERVMALGLLEGHRRMASSRTWQHLTRIQVKRGLAGSPQAIEAVLAGQLIDFAAMMLRTQPECVAT
jgi:hypothetical protein